MPSSTLIINLSPALHLSDEFNNQRFIYAGPQLNDSNSSILTSSKPKLSDILNTCRQKGHHIHHIFIYCDVFSLSVFQPIIDIAYPSMIAIIGDTHHGSRPLTPLIQWLHHSRISKIVLKQTIHHAPIFRSFGFSVLQLQYYAHDVELISPSPHFINRICFVGSLSSSHHKRKLFLEKLITSGLPIDIFTAPRKLSFKYYNHYALSFNMPLNFDFNYRINEIMSAGGVCLTPRLPKVVENLRILNHFQDSLLFEDYDSCIDLARNILNDSKLRNSIAINAHNRLSMLKSTGSNLQSIQSFNDTTAPQNLDIRASLFNSLRTFEEFQSSLTIQNFGYYDINIANIPKSWRFIFK